LRFSGSSKIPACAEPDRSKSNSEHELVTENFIRGISPGPN
jgi:hypothetical protein